MKRDVELLFEIGMLRHLPRQWVRFGGMNTANLADHHFRVAWTAMMIAKQEKVKVSYEKILKMALVHDLGESRTNDVDYISRQYSEQNDTLAISDIFHETSLKDEFIELFNEYEARKTLESKIVKDADHLDIDLEIQEQDAMGVKIKEWLTHRKTVRDNHFYTESAKRLHDQIKKSNPNDWHSKSTRNRVNGGDWKKS